MTAWLLSTILCAAWLAGGLVLVRRGLGVRDGLEACGLAVPVGLLAQILTANGAAYALGAPWALLLSPLAALASLPLLRRAPALEWHLSRRRRLVLGALALGLFGGAWYLGHLELFGDDGGHGSMAHVLAAGHFPPRFHANPELSLSYAYGPDLLAAQVMLWTRALAWNSIDLARAAMVLGVLALAFLAGFRPRRSLGAGLLTAFLLASVGPLVWIYLPLATGGLARWAARMPALTQLVSDLLHMTDNPWRYAVVVPGFLTSTYAHAQRALAWGVAPLPVLLALALLELPLSSRRRSLALGLVLAATALTQSASLLLLAPALASYAWLRRRTLDLNIGLVLAPALLLGLFQGGPISDSLLDRLRGVANPTASFHFDPLQWPSCRGREHTLRCGLLSLANLGLMPWLLIWAARSAWSRAQPARLALALGCACSYAFPFFWRYDYIDWNIQRLLTYAGWSAAALVGPLLWERLQVGGRARLVALVALLFLTHQGLAAWAVVVDGRWLRDRVDLAFFKVGPLDERLAIQTGPLPLEAVVFDPEPCATGTFCRPALLFGAYTSYSRERLEYWLPNAAHDAALADPSAANLRAHGYTHAYLDSSWLGAQGEEMRQRLAGDAFRAVATASDPTGFRALLRVCGPRETCHLSWPGVLD